MIALYILLIVSSIGMVYYTNRRKLEEIRKQHIESAPVEDKVLKKLRAAAEDLNRAEEALKVSMGPIGNLDTKGKIQVGSTFTTDVESAVVRIFYYEDKQFGIVCPKMGKSYVDLPGIVEIEEGRAIHVWTDVRNLETGIVDKGIELYKEFRKQNKSKFIKAV